VDLIINIPLDNDDAWLIWSCQVTGELIGKYTWQVLVVYCGRADNNLTGA
jgi:hypothetical protein